MKITRIITIVFTTLSSGIVILSGVMKLTKSDQVVNTMTHVGVGDYITALGLMEIIFAALFVYSRTMRIGFILLSCYFAGAIATELSHNGPVVNATIPLTLIWIAAFLRDRSLFISRTVPSIKA